MILNLDIMKQFKKLKIWSDCGPHFRNKEYLYYISHNLPNNFEEITVNYFAEYHGKSPCDAHFSLISKWFKTIELKKKIRNTNELLEELTIMANQVSKNPVKFLLHTREKRSRYYNILEIEDLKLYHCFKTSNYNNIIIASIYSKDIKFGINIKYNIKQKEDDRKNKTAPILIEDDETFAISQYNKKKKELNILKKQKKIENENEKLNEEILHLSDILLKLKI